MTGASAPGYDWLATGGAYYIIGLAWLLGSLFFLFNGFRVGKISNSENDGCLLAFCGIVLTITGGGIGLALGLRYAGYPTFVLTSLIGAILLPGIVTSILSARMKRPR